MKNLIDLVVYTTLQIECGASNDLATTISVVNDYVSVNKLTQWSDEEQTEIATNIWDEVSTSAFSSLYEGPEA